MADASNRHGGGPVTWINCPLRGLNYFMRQLSF
jgi:hypothetical protein